MNIYDDCFVVYYQDKIIIKKIIDMRYFDVNKLVVNDNLTNACFELYCEGKDMFEKINHTVVDNKTTLYYRCGDYDYLIISFEVKKQNISNIINKKCRIHIDQDNDFIDETLEYQLNTNNIDSKPKPIFSKLFMKEDMLINNKGKVNKIYVLTSCDKFIVDDFFYVMVNRIKKAETYKLTFLNYDLKEIDRFSPKINELNGEFIVFDSYDGDIVIKIDL